MMMMRRLVGAAVLALVTATLVSTPAQGASLRAKYQHRYDTVQERFEKRTPGRNIVEDGMRTRKGKVRQATSEEVARSARTFKRWLAPPVATVVAGDQAPAAPAQAGGSYAIPQSIVMCESGGDYGALNPSSGAGGAYQILPDTWEDYGGTGAPHTAPPAEQDEVAKRVWEGQGRGAWVC